MIKDLNDFTSQVEILRNGISLIPQLDLSKIMESDEINTYFSEVETALNELSQHTRILEDCNEFIVRYTNEVIDSKKKEFQNKLQQIEDNYNLYVDKNFISYNVNKNTTKTINDRDGSVVSNVDYTVQQQGSIDLLKNISPIDSYDVVIDKDAGTCIIHRIKNNIVSTSNEVATLFIQLTKPTLLNYVGVNLLNCDGVFTINNDLAEYKFNTYFKPVEISNITITLIAKNFDRTITNVRKNPTKSFMDNAYAPTNVSGSTDKEKESELADIYYNNDVTKYIGELHGNRN